jgi:hypothetical protein
VRDKRTFRRLKSDWDVEYQIFKREKAKSAVLTSAILDMGGGGFCLESDAPLERETLIQFAIRPEDDPKPIIGVARTVWSRAFNGTFKNGTSFVWARWNGSAAQRIIAEYVEEHLNEKLT